MSASNHEKQASGSPLSGEGRLQEACTCSGYWPFLKVKSGRAPSCLSSFFQNTCMEGTCKVIVPCPGLIGLLKAVK